MKYIITLMILLLSLSSCTRSPQEKACIAIREYLKENLDDPKSYEPGKFEVDEVKDGGQLSGWNISHSFRAKNRLGALVLHQEDFWVDKDYHVTYNKPWSPLDR